MRPNNAVTVNYLWLGEVALMRRPVADSLRTVQSVTPALDRRSRQPALEYQHADGHEQLTRVHVGLVQRPRRLAHCKQSSINHSLTLSVAF